MGKFAVNDVKAIVILLPIFHEFFRIVCGAVVGDDPFEILASLGQKGSVHLAKGVSTVICCCKDGYSAHIQVLFIMVIGLLNFPSNNLSKGYSHIVMMMKKMNMPI